MILKPPPPGKFLIMIWKHKFIINLELYEIRGNTELPGTRDEKVAV